MTPEQKIEKLFKHVRENGQYVERDHKTIGGMWTVDTWVLGNLKVQLQDEGATRAVLADGLNVAQTCDFPAKFYKGTEEDLDRAFEALA